MNIPSALETAQQRVTEIMSQTTPADIAASEHIRDGLVNELMTTRQFDRSEAESIVDLYRRRATGELLPAEVEYFKQADAMAERWRVLEQRRALAIEARDSLRAAQTNLDLHRKTLAEQRDLLANLDADLANVTGARALAAQQSFGHATNPIGGMLEFARSVVVAREAVSLLREKVIPHCERQLDQAEAHLAEIQRAMADAR